MFEKTKEKLELKRLEKEKKTLEEEKRVLEEEKKTLEERQISIKDLYVVELGITHLSGSLRKGNFGSGFYSLDKFTVAEKESKFCYIDVFSASEYTHFSGHCSSGDLCCDRPIPFISFLNLDSELSKQILLQGWIYYKDLIKLWTELIELHNDKGNHNKSLAAYLSNDKVYNSEPAFERDKEVNEVITSLAGLKKSPLLVGLSGVGKTTIVEELVYKIQNGNVPKFLKDKKILEVDMTNVVSSINSNIKYVGDLEEKLKKIIEYAIKNDAILFIDEIHRIIGADATSKVNNDIVEMLKRVIDREIKVIVTTTEDGYNKYFSDNALGRKFDRIDIKEPSNKDLRIIIEKVFKNYSSSFEISLDNINYILDQIIEILINLTSKDSRNQMDIENNPSLVIGIIDKAFSDARVNSEDNLSIDNIITAIASSSRIYEMSREKAISKLKLIEPKSMKLYNDNVVKFSNKEKD